MKFVAAKCPNCGARIKIEKGKKVYTCEYCRYDILLDDNGKFDFEGMQLSDEQIASLKKAGKFAMIPIAIVALLFILFFTFILFNIINIGNNVKDDVDDFISDENNSQLDNLLPEVSVNNFNFYLDDTGVYSASTISTKLNYVIDNLEEYDKEIVVVFNNKEITDVEEIKNVILEISKDVFMKYSYVSQKDSLGYVNKVIINNS